MSLDVQNLALLLVHNSAWITLAAAVTYCLICWSRLQSLLWQQVAWFLVLLPAACLVNVRYPVAIVTPWPDHRIVVDSQGSRFSASPQSNSLTANSSLTAAAEPTTAAMPTLDDLVQEEAPLSQLVANTNISQDSIDLAQRTSHAVAAQAGTAGARPTKMVTASPESLGSTMPAPPRAASADASMGSWLAASLSLVLNTSWPSLIGQAFVLIWLAGTGLLVAWYFLQIVAFQFALRDSVPARPAFQKQWLSLLKACKVGKPIQLVEHTSFGPMLTITPRGWTVVVPSDFWEELTRQQRLGILRHELAHYQHGDLAWSLVARLLATLQWFNPLAWYALARFDECTELRCDESILRDGSIRPTDYAQALVQLIEYPRLSLLAARSAGGASLAHRVRKLLAGRAGSDSRTKRLLWSCALGLMVASSLVRPQFVPTVWGQESPTSPIQPTPGDANQSAPAPTFAEASESETAATSDSASQPPREAAVNALMAKLTPRGEEDRELVRQFTQAVSTPAGQVVMASVIHQWEEQLRQQAEAETTLAFAGEMFEKSGDKFVLKKEHAEFPARFEKACRQFDEDAATVARLLQDYSSRLLDDSEANQLVKRFFLDPDAPAQIYVEQVQNRVRPDYRVVREQWDDIFVLDRDNRLVLRSGAKRLAEQQVKRLTRARLLADRLHRALGQWSKDLSDSNDVSKAVRAAMTEKTFAAIFATQSMDEEYSSDQKINDYFDYLENIFVDKADGLVPNEEATAEIDEKLKTYAASKLLGAKLQPHLATMARQLDDSVPSAPAWRELLVSDIGVLMTVENMGVPAADVQTALQNWLSEWLDQAEGGKWTVNPDQQEGVIYATRERLRNARAFRRRGLDIVEFGKQIDHPTLSAAYQTTAGKSLVMRSLQDRLSRQYFDGLGAWVNENLDGSDDGYTLKEGHESVLQEIISEIERVKQELANDDF